MSRFEVGNVTPDTDTGLGARGIIECVVTNDRGQHAVRTISIGGPG